MRKILHQSIRSTIFREYDPVTNQEVIWKTSGPNKHSVNDLLNEFTICNSVRIDGIRKPIRRGLFKNKDAFAYVYFEGIALSQYLKEFSFSLEECLSHAITIATILEQLHKKEFSHNRLNSHNILYNPNTKEFQIIDFSLANHGLVEKKTDFMDWGEELAFISPEQMGRWNQIADHRTDLYSFGVILYQMLTGKLPFFDTDISNLIHYHLVRLPTPPHEIKDWIPHQLSTIVLKLLKKNADDRYQTFHGLVKDLQHTLNAVIEGRSLDLNELGKFDRVGTIHFSQKLYGNQGVIALLDSTPAKGQNQIWIFSGEAGTGKTANIQLLRKSLQDRNEISIILTFDDYESDNPYKPYLTGLKELSFWLLTLSKTQLQEWKPILQRSIGKYESDLVSQVPEFRWILDSKVEIEPQTSLPDLRIIQTVFLNLVQQLLDSQFVVTLLIDDIHEAGKELWSSLNQLSRHTSSGNLRIVITAIPAEEETSLFKQLTQLQKKQSESRYFELKNLTAAENQAFLNDSFKLNNSELFGSIVYKKTKGNPLYIRQFIEKCLEYKYIWYEFESYSWDWDQVKVNYIPPTRNIIDSLLKQVEQPDFLPNNKLAGIAACFKGDINPRLLQLLQGIDPSLLNEHLSELVESQILVESDNGFQFSHEDLRVKIEKLLSESEKSGYHFQLAEILSTPEWKDHSYATIFNIARHYTLGSAQIAVEDQFRVVDQNLKAGKAAAELADFKLAYHYFVEGIRFVKNEDWELHYEQVLSLYNQATEAGMINGYHSEADQWLEQALLHARTIDDRVKSYDVKLIQFSENHQFEEAVNSLLVILEEIGYGVPRRPTKFDILREMVHVLWEMRNKSIESLADKPRMQDQKALAFLKVVVNSGTSIFGFAPELIPVVYLRCYRLTLTHGLSIYAPYAYIGYAGIQLFLGRTQAGYQYGLKALDLVDQLSTEIVRAKVMVIFYGFIAFWKESMRNTLEPLRKAYDIALQNGDLLYASFALLFRSTFRLHTGDNLVELAAAIQKDNQKIAEMNQTLVLVISDVQYHFILRLIHGTDDPVILRENDMDESALLAKLDKIGDTATKFDLYVYKMIHACLLNYYSEAQHACEQAHQFEEESTSRQNTYPSFLLFSTITLLFNARQHPSGKDTKVNKQIREKLKLMKKHAGEAPQNFENKYLLAQALYHENQGLHHQTIDYYEDAIHKSQEHNFLHEEALAREYFGKYLFKMENTEYGTLMLQKSFDAYKKWGAGAKCNQFKKEFPDLFGDQMLVEKNITMEIFQDRFDLASIIKANQTLSSENTLEGLLVRMIEIAIQNASVTKALILLINQEQKFIPKALGATSGIKILTGDENEVLYPENIIQWVIHTKSAFTNQKSTLKQLDLLYQYGQENVPLSVCCLPITSQNAVLGLLYLENNMAVGVFDEKRVDFFTTISSQLAISLDNVLLYEDMENKVQQRTIALEQSLKELKSTQESLIQKEKLASLGELMAGIAHEIQNPLNFVNNFSEVSTELLEDLDVEVANGNTDEASFIISDLKENLEKINHHGHRAGNIIRGMLEHVKSKPGEKAAYPINGIIEEFLRLSYQNMHLKAVNFDCNLILNLDNSIGPMLVSVSDLGRVFLNLFNNAFYATYQRQLMEESNYQPELTIATKKINSHFEIRIKDNGTGIPEDIQSKIFQPFFTTKPTGDNTGLGLSLSYDIITKGHGGSIRFESVLNQGTEFIIEIPFESQN